ncbi:MAG: YceI family protein [Ignavibacteriales bacterium]|nr:YceI family protein [Ignavibacteriales bacterium]
MKKLFYSAFMVLFALLSINAQTKWTIDNAHSKVQFTVTHLIISEVTGQFKSFDGNIESSKDDFSDAKIDFSADIASINTDNEKRDTHLKSDDFFNAEKFPKMTFKGKSLKKIDEKNYKLVGDFTIRDVTKEVTLDVVYNGTVQAWGQTKAGFKIKGEINRFDYNLKWNALMEAGGAVVGKTVYITVDLELQKSK